MGNQDRIVRLEFRLRYWQLYGETATGIEEQLSFSQIAAVRFAKDTEFKTLIAKTIAESLNADEIKKSITDWKGDYMRV